MTEDDDNPQALAADTPEVEVLPQLPDPGQLAFPNLLRFAQAYARREMEKTGRKTPFRDSILFRSFPSFGFPGGEVASLKALPESEDWPLEAEVTFLGFYGTSSPLPNFWTERVLAGGQAADNIRDLLDLFGNPLVHILGDIWRHCHLYAQFRNADVKAFAQPFLALGGLDSAVLSDKECLRLLPLSGLLSQYERSAPVLERILSAYMGMTVRVVEGVLRRIVLPRAAQFLPGAAGVALGQGLRLGESFEDTSTTIAITITAQDSEALQALLPGGERHSALCAFTRTIMRDPLACRIDVVIEQAANAAFRLGESHLGWTSWLSPQGEQAIDVGFV
ncbi:type VI secretion system baseplate subunit TssG [Acetobacter vaccinii]|uniref:Type VI secretion system baseplate subunit TssG n=1 Tax=Acetobacter vaccinii TaxID=2592655 RepID=A0A5C1YNP2_9PROT|nr:type VI secretion system baseplate subunit TssG [Acetobacter vaccinii]QEO16462.1 type VI secretion system baseplate subunit TssG [Acetobacter vaccinii]